jgi:hypothetical protein
MKKILILATLIFSTVFCFAQKLEKNEVDEFTGNSVKRTSWEDLVLSNNLTDLANTFASKFRISKIDDFYYFDFKLMLSGDFSIEEGQLLMLKLGNDSIVKLSNLEHKTTCLGCGAVGVAGSKFPGISVSYVLSTEQIDELKKHKAVKIRVYKSDGYVEREIKEKNAKKFIKALEIIE